jgi:hypothetical protein
MTDAEVKITQSNGDLIGAGSRASRRPGSYLGLDRAVRPDETSVDHRRPAHTWVTGLP